MAAAVDDSDDNDEDNYDKYDDDNDSDDDGVGGADDDDEFGGPDDARLTHAEYARSMRCTLGGMPGLLLTETIKRHFVRLRGHPQPP